MRLRSTCLGKTELEGKIVSVKKVDDVLIFFMDVIKPVKWHTRMAFEEKDLRNLVLALVKPKNLSYVIKSFFSDQEKAPKTETF
jgi:hypothetical protein